jgi:hypothetical protein
MSTMTEAGLISRMSSFQTRRGGLAKQYQRNLDNLCATHANNVRRALPLFTGAASPADYQRLLSSTLTSAGLTVQAISITLHDSSTNPSGYCGSSRRPTVNASYHDFYERVRADENTGRTRGSFYFLDVKGHDPDSLLVSHVFDPLFGEAFKQAANNWFLAKP